MEAEVAIALNQLALKALRHQRLEHSDRYAELRQRSP
jgi:hypothetical protein